jgi:hypothetical protein
MGQLTGGPGSRLNTIVPVYLPRRRGRGDPAFGALYERVAAIVSEEVNRRAAVA